MMRRRTRPERRATARKLQSRREVLRSKLEGRRRAARAALARRREGLAGARPRQRRRWLSVALLLLLLLLLLRDCCCREPAPPAPPPADCPSGPAPAVEALPAASPAPALPRGRVGHRGRPEFVSDALDPLPWLAAYQLQVSARSPRLAQCFVGAQRPGTLKWTASVEPSQGVVSDQTLEPTLLSDALTQQQRSCVLGVLSDPPYQLESDDERSTPVRVGMVIEF